MDFSWELLFELLGNVGKPTVMQEVRQLYCIYKIQLRERKAPVYQQISGTGQRRWRMIKEAERYLDYARVDWEYRK